MELHLLGKRVKTEYEIKQNTTVWNTGILHLKPENKAAAFYKEFLIYYPTDPCTMY